MLRCCCRRPKSDTRSLGLFGAFRFLDVKLEEEYQSKANGWQVFMARCHAAFFLVWFGSSAIYFGVLQPLSQIFWGNMMPAALSVLLLLATMFVRGKRRCVLLHAAFCVALTGVTSWMAVVQMASMVSAIQTQWLPIIADDLRAAHLYDPFVGFIGGLSTSIAHLGWTAVARWQLIALAFVGYSWSGAFAMLCNVAAAIAIAVVDPYATAPTLGSTLTEDISTTAAFWFLAITTEKLRRAAFLTQTLLARELHNSQTSDSILNHTLKNTLADGAGNIELFLKKEVGADESMLRDALISLRRGIKACRDRQAYLKLVAGSYVPTFSAINLRVFGEQLIAGRRVVGVFIDRVVFLDQTLVTLIIDNAIHNAMKHGCPANPDVRFSIWEEAATEQTPAGHVPIVMRVTNRARPDRQPLTPDFVEKAFAGKPLLRSDEVPALSDRIGLGHCLMAASAHDISLRLHQDAGVVSFTAVVNLKVALPRRRSAASQHTTPDFGEFADVEAFPPGLRYYLIDDSVASLRLMESQLKHGAAPGEVRLFGRQEEEVAAFVAEALKFADVVVSDQNLEYGAHSYFGTDLIAQLAARGFRGLLCIRSANMCPADCALYQASGAHCLLGKDLSAQEFVHGIKAAYLRLRPPQNGSACHTPAAPFPSDPASEPSLLAWTTPSNGESGLPLCSTFSPL